MRMVAMHLLGVISLTASGMGLRLLNCAFKIAKMANKWSQLHFQSHNQWSWNRTWHFFTSDTLPRDGDEWFWCPKTSFEDQRIRLTCSDNQVRELWRHGETYLSLIIGLALSEVQNLYLLLRRVDLYSLKIMYAHMSKCVCVCLCTYVEVRGRYWVLTLAQPLFFITLNQGILLNLGLGLLAWLAASNLGIFLIPSHLVLGLLMGAGIWTRVIMIAVQVLWTDKPFLLTFPLKWLYWHTSVRFGSYLPLPVHLRPLFLPATV